YLFIALLLFILIELYHAYTAKQLKPFFGKLAYLFAAALLAIAINAGSLWSTWQYGQESIRGKANIAKADGSKNTGLDRDYAYEYSQDVGEIGTFLIPNLYGGGSSNRFPEGRSEVAKALSNQGVPQEQIQPLIGEVNQAFQGVLSRPYWGSKPGTAGPWYFGAIVIFLFILGL
ncbi:TPA: hypothetical protein R1S30_005044, partial [Escherichia coli]|nr:hypothetical protein [Escherichia coli]